MALARFNSRKGGKQKWILEQTLNADSQFAARFNEHLS
jgi:hypothetical protein